MTSSLQGRPFTLSKSQTKLQCQIQLKTNGSTEITSNENMKLGQNLSPTLKQPIDSLILMLLNLEDYFIIFSVMTKLISH